MTQQQTIKVVRANGGKVANGQMLKFNVMRFNPADPASVPHLQTYELEQTAALSLEARATLVRYGKKMTVRQLICLCCRHSVWHAGQIALTKVD